MSRGLEPELNGKTDRVRIAAVNSNVLADRTPRTDVGCVGPVTDVFIIESLVRKESILSHGIRVDLGNRFELIIPN